MVSARQAAERYDRYAAVFRDHYGTGRWRTELANVRIFMAWIESSWWDDGPIEPASQPDAISSDGEHDLVRWYDGELAVLGYPVVTGVRGCYQVLATDSAPPLGQRSSRMVV